MKTVLLEIRTSGRKTNLEAELADNFFSRFLGLMGRRETRGLLLKDCNQIHTFFMRFPIDVYYLDKEGTVIRIERNIKPWRIRPLVWKARSVLELAAGTEADIEIGSRISAANT